MSDLNGRVVVITGGASGIGRALAGAFEKEGSRVVLVDIDEERGLQVARELGGAPFSPLTCRMPGPRTGSPARSRMR